MGRYIVYTGIRLLLLTGPFISSFFFLFNFQTLNFFLTLFSGTVRPRRLKLGTHMDSGQMYCVYWNQAAAAYSSLYFFIFLFLKFQTLKVFVTLFSRTVRPGRLILDTHGQWADVLCIPESGCCCLFVPLFLSFFFLSNFQTLKIFVTLFSRTVRPRRLKLGTHVDIGWMYGVYCNQAASSYLSLISLFFFLSNVQKLKIFVTFFSGTVRPRKFKLGTLVNSGWMYLVYQNRAAAPYLSLYFFIFLSLKLSNINIFRHIFLRNCEA